MLQDRPVAELLDWAVRFEQAGIDSVWVADHLAYPQDPSRQWYDGWALLAAIAHSTTTVRIGPLVSTFVLHPPAQLARLAVTLDALSAGRLDLGVGAGGAPIDRSAMGISDRNYRELMRRFADGLEQLDTLLRGGAIPLHPLPPVAGREVPATFALATPSVQRPRPPIVIGGQGPTTIDLAARYADKWNTFALGTDREVLHTLQQNLELLHARCEAHGRTPTAVTPSLLLDFAPKLRPGSAAALADVVAWAQELGFREVIAYAWIDGVLDRPTEDLLTFATDHLSALRTQ
jgi:alkanesulfonate monooxygenase SsuD/methylene tetrahydromethanopterin reductase-like flavin-dependent oxidoreductase (luciferase family)